MELWMGRCLLVVFLLQLRFAVRECSQSAVSSRIEFTVLKRGDRVRRSINWTWGNQDGEFNVPKRFGTVLEVVDWHNESGKGLIVHWDLTEQTNIYRYGANNDTVYDVEPIKETRRHPHQLPATPTHLERASMTTSKNQPAVKDLEVKRALLRLYESLDGANWGHREFWGNASMHPCEGPWQGIRCDGNNTILALDLRENKLSGTLPRNIFHSLTSLVSLNLGLNNITGTIPSQLGLLSKLRFLDLHQNALSGSLPTTLSKCRGLEWIDLSANRLEGSLPAQIGELQALQYCFLGRNRLDVKPSNLPTDILQLPSLVRGHPRLERNEPVSPLYT